MNKFPLDLDSLAPREAKFTLSTVKTPLTLCRWSLRVRAWAFDKYGPQKLREIFEKHRIVEISEMAFFMLKEKEGFATLADFQDAVVTNADQVNLIKALLESVGIGEPEIEKISAALQKKKEVADPNPQSPENP